MDNPFKRGFSNQSANAMGFPTSGESATGTSTKQQVPAQRMQNPYEHTRAPASNPLASGLQPVLGQQSAQGAQFPLKPTELSPQVSGFLRSQGVVQNMIAQQQASNQRGAQQMLPPEGSQPMYSRAPEAGGDARSVGPQRQPRQSASIRR